MMHTFWRCPEHSRNIQILRAIALIFVTVVKTTAQQTETHQDIFKTKTIRQVPPIILRKLDKRIRITRDCWILSISIPLQGHLDYVKKLKEATHAFDTQADLYFRKITQEAEFRLSPSTYYNANYSLAQRAVDEDTHTLANITAEGLKSRIRQLVTEVDTIDKHYTDLARIYLSLDDNDSEPYVPTEERILYTRSRSGNNPKGGRHKRSLPFLLGALTGGLAITNYARTVANSNNIRTLASNQHQIIANQNAFTLILNSSVDAIESNRRHVVELHEHVNDLISNLQTMLQKLQDSVYRVIKLRSLTSAITQTLAFLTHQCDSARVELHSLQSHLNLALRGSFPVNLISYNKLTAVLREVSASMSHEYKVEYTAALYLSPAYIYASNSTIYVVVSLPLVKPSEPKYTIFEIINHPYFEGSEVVKLDIPTDRYLALESNGENFKLLTQDQLSMCMLKSRSVCQLNNAEFQMNTDKSCIAGWYLRNKQKIKNYCHKRILSLRQIPQTTATIVTNNHAIIFTPTPRNLREICPEYVRSDTTKFLTIQAGNTIVPITPGCTIMDKGIKFTAPIRSSYSTRADNFVYLQIEYLNGIGLANLSALEFKSDNITLETFSFTNPKAPEWIVGKLNTINERFSFFKTIDFSTNWKLYLSLAIIGILIAVGIAGYVYIKFQLRKAQMISKAAEGTELTSLVPNFTPQTETMLKELSEAPPLCESAFEFYKSLSRDPPTTASVIPTWTKHIAALAESR